MVAIPTDNTNNARNMLDQFATFLGWLGDIRYYVLDGRAWCIIGGTIYRDDDGEATETVLRYKRTGLLRT